MAAYGEAGLRQDGGAGGAGRGRDGAGWSGAGRVGRQRRGRGAAQQDGGWRAAPVSNRGLHGGHWCGPGNGDLALGARTGVTGAALETVLWRWGPVLGSPVWPWEHHW